MKKIAVTKLAPLVIATVFVMTLPATYALAEDLPEIQKMGNVTYVTGGIGDEERDAMRAVQTNYNLHVLSVAGGSGEYPGDTHIIICDKQGNELINADADPLFYAKLPAGHYKVEETSDGQTKKQSVVIGTTKPVNITFRWQ